MAVVSQPWMASLPDPRGYEAVGWIVVAIFALLTLLATGLGVVMIGFAVFDRIRGKGPLEIKSPVVMKASEEVPSRVEFEMHVNSLDELRLERKSDVKDIMGQIREVSDKIDRFSGDQYKARGRMHQKLNRVENALIFLAGRFEGAGDKTAAAQLKSILTPAAEEESR